MTNKCFLLPLAGLLLASCATRATMVSGGDETEGPRPGSETAPSTALHAPSELPAEETSKAPSATPTTSDCFVHIEGTPQGERFRGAIVLREVDASNSQHKVIVIDLEAGGSRLLGEQGDSAAGFALSPDFRRAAYIRGREATTGTATITRDLVLLGVGAVEEGSLRWRDDWGPLIRWLDDTRLLVSVSRPSKYGDRYETSSAIVINPTTGEAYDPAPAIPDLYDGIPSPYWDGQGPIALDPSLTRAVYVREQQFSRAVYGLWDLEDSGPLGEVVSGGWMPVPVWSSNSGSVAVPYFPSPESTALELAIISRDGEVRRLTHLDELFHNPAVQQLSWSPDSSMIAFWFAPDSSLLGLPGAQYLGVVDTQTGSLTMTCVNGDIQVSEGAPPPIWSPSGDALLVRSQAHDGSFSVILVDMGTGTAYNLSPSYEPLGWLADL